MICPDCEKFEMAEAAEEYPYTECGLKSVILSGIIVRRCPGCGNIMPRIPAIEGLHDAIAQVLVKKAERLAPEEIVFLRKSLGWSGADFSRNMHCDRHQVSKWEHGTVQMSKAYELLLREMVASGKKIEDYHRVEAGTKSVFRQRAVLLKLEKQKWREAA